MISLKLCRNILIRFFVVLVIISSFLNLPAYCQESEDSQIFISGFNAYQQKNYATTINKMNEVLQKFPDTPLRDMVLFWLARAYYKNGNLQDAARFMSQFSKEYPDNPLKGTVDEELLALTARYDKGEKLPTGSLPATATDRQLVAQKAEVEKARLAREKLEKEQRAKDQAERERVAAAKAEATRVAAAAETARLAAVRIAEERTSAEAAEQLRLAAVTREEERKAAEKTEQLRVDREKAELARLAALRKERERIASARAEEERRSQEKTAVAKRAIEEAEQQKLTSLKVEEERKVSEKLAAERELLEKTDNEQIVKQQDELVRLALEKTEKKRKAAEKIEEKQSSAEAAARAVKADQRRLAALKAEEERVAAVAETARLAAAQKELERKAAAKVEAEQQAQEKAALAKRAAAEAEQQKLALLKQEQERIAAERAEKERLAVAAAEASQRAAIKQEQLQRQPEKAVAVVEIAKPVPAKRGEQRKVPQRKADEKARAAKAALREKAIAQYKFILVTYPNTKAASTASVKLKELGVAVALPQVAAVEQLPENAQILRLEVAQFAGLEFNLTTRPQAYNISQRISIPFEITNRGNGSDSFYLESGFPAEFIAGFAAAAQPEQTVNQTTILAPGESFNGVINLVIPPTSIDGLRISYTVKAASRLLSEATQSREVMITAAAPLLRAIVKTDKVQLVPGEKAVYRVTVLNVGSTAAQGVTLRLNFPPQLEALDYAAVGFRQEMKTALVLDGLQIKSGESREFSLLFQLKDDSLAGQELLTRVELVNNPLKTAAVFVSNAAYVQQQHGVLVRTASERQVVIPGQAIFVPFVVTNTGNVREKFRIAPSVKGAQETIIFQDINRDGSRQANEPLITEVGPLAPKEEASIVMEIKTPRSATDGSQGSAQIVFSSEGDASRSSSGAVQFVYSRPVLQMAMTARDGRLKPGEVASFDLTITNRGSNLARVVELLGTWPEQLELIAAEPSSSSASNGNILWNFKEVGAGEKRTIKVSFRVKPGTGVGTNIQVKNLLSYEDQLGNRY